MSSARARGRLVAARGARQFRHIPAIALLFSTSPLLMPAYASAICLANLDRSTPDADLIDNGDATVTHLRTGLTWKQCIEGYSGTNCVTGVIGGQTWAQAQAAAIAANNAQFAGHNDWRLPNYKELESIVDTGCQNPSINTTRFPNTPPGQFWSSTGFGSAPAAWYVNFISGGSGVNAKSTMFNTRLVRGGQGPGAFDSVTAGSRSTTGPSPTGSGTIGASFTGGGASCGFAYSQFVLPNVALPAGVTFAHGLFDFSAFGCTVSSSLTFTVTYPASLPSGTVFWRYGPTPGNTAPHWYILPATIAGNQLQYTIADGQAGDDDLVANGLVSGLGGPGTDRIFRSGFE